MATLTIRKIPDEQIQQLKEVAEKNNRSMESQVRSILEEWLAGTVAHEITRKTNFYDEIREFMKNMDFEGLDKGELPLSERNSADSRRCQLAEEPRYKQFGNHRHHRRRVVGRNMSHA